MKRKQKNRCKDLGCSLKDYDKEWKKSAYKNHMKYPELFGIGFTQGQINHVRKMINNGYIFTSKEDYLSSKPERASLGRVKRSPHKDLPKKYNHWGEVPREERNEVLKKRSPTAGTLANWMGMKVDDVPEELLEIRLINHLISKEVRESP